jgi:hypothetical protein
MRIILTNTARSAEMPIKQPPTLPTEVPDKKPQPFDVETNASLAGAHLGNLTPDKTITPDDAAAREKQLAKESQQPRQLNDEEVPLGGVAFGVAPIADVANPLPREKRLRPNEAAPTHEPPVKP